MVIDVINNVILVPLKLSIIGCAILFITARSRNKSASALHCILFISVLSAVIVPILVGLIPKINFEILPKVVSSLTQYSPYYIDNGTVNYKLIPSLLFCVYALGSSWIICYKIMGIFAAAKITKRASPYSAIDHICAPITEALNVTRSVQIKISPEVHGAQTWGAISPVVLVPSDIEEWPEARVKRVLTHEIAHIRRNDWLFKNVAYFIVALFWFIPPLWTLLNKMEWYAELACDDFVVNRDEERAEYAEDLLTIAADINHRKAKSSQYTTAINTLSILESSIYFQRIEAVLDATKIRSSISTTEICGILFIAIILLAPIASFQAVATASHQKMTRYTIEYPFALLKQKNQKLKNNEQNSDVSNWDVIMAQKPLAATQPPPQEQMVITNQRLTMDNKFDALKQSKASLKASIKENINANNLDMIDVAMPSPVVTISGFNPLHSVIPDYPRSALKRGTEGHVIVSFTVLEDGSVATPKIVRAEPNNIFNKSVLKAVSKFRFEPQRVEGEPVVINNVMEEFTFQIVDE